MSTNATTKPRSKSLVFDDDYGGFSFEEHQDYFFVNDEQPQHHQHVDVNVIELCTTNMLAGGDVSTLSDTAFLHEYFDTTSTADATIGLLVRQESKASTIRSFEQYIYDSDEDDEPPQGVISLGDRLSWRQNPEISLFDWKIDVVTTVPADDDQEEDTRRRKVYIYSDAFKSTTDQNVSIICPCVEVVPVTPTSSDAHHSTTTYYVHKNMLAMGPRRSEFFARMFLRQGSNGAAGGQNQNSNHQYRGGGGNGNGGHYGTYSRRKGLTTRLELPPMVAAQFPLLLDYLYTPELVLTYTTETATALYHLAKFLDIRSLRHESKQFWDADVRLHAREKWILYYKYGKILRDDKIIKVAIQCCVDQGFLDLGLFEDDDNLYDDVEFWLDVVRNVKINTELSLKLSQLLTMYFTHNFDTVALEDFEELTLARHLPYIHVDAVLALMDAERQIARQGASAASLSDFQHRCIETIASNWDRFDTLHDSATMCILEKQNPLVLAKLLASALSAAKTDNQELTDQKQRLSAENAELHAAQHLAMQSRNAAYNTDRQQLVLRRERLRRERDGRLKEVSACLHDLASGSNTNKNNNGQQQQQQHRDRSMSSSGITTATTTASPSSSSRNSRSHTSSSNNSSSTASGGGSSKDSTSNWFYNPTME